MTSVADRRVAVGLSTIKAVLLSTTFLLTFTVAAQAQEAIAEASADPEVQRIREEVKQQREMLTEQQRKLNEQIERVTEQQRQIEYMQAQMRAQAMQNQAPKNGLVPAIYRGRPPSEGNYGYDAAQAPGATTPPGGAASPIAPQGEQQRPEIPDAAVADVGGVLTPRGALILDPSFEYSYADQNRVVIEGVTITPGVTFGTTDIRRINRYTYTANLGARYGVTSRFEVDAKVPFLHRNDSTTRREVGATVDTTTSVDGSGLGDIEVGAHYQLNRGTEGWPFLVSNLRFKTITGKDPFEVALDPDTGLEQELPTGSGFYSLEPSLTAIVPTDPAVFYGSVRYIWNIERSVTIPSAPGAGVVGGEADIDPGDGVGIVFGMGLAINELTSFSIGYEHTHFFETTQNGTDIAGSDFDTGSLTFGLSHKLSDRTSLNLSAALGMTDSAPDARVIVRLPVRLF